LWVIIIYGFFIEFLVNLIMGYVPHRPLKITLYASFTFFEFLFFSYFFYLQIRSKTFKKYMIVSSTLFCLFIVIYYLTVKFSRIDSLPIGIETIFIIIFSFYYLYEELNNTTTLFIYTKPAFWIILGMVLYLSGSFFIYIASGYYSKDIVGRYWFVTNILTVIKNIFFCIAIISHAKNSGDKIDYHIEPIRQN
jgi:hypothetical protein